MRTLEEIADWLHEAVRRPGVKQRKPDGFNRDLIVAALREAVAQRDMEWWEAVGGVDNVAPDPEACKRWQMSLQQLAVAQERAALRKWAEENKEPYDEIGPDELDYDSLLACLDAREKKA